MDPRDKKKSHWELTMEIEELKKKKNKDAEDIKMVKVELHNLQVLYKRCKQMQQGQGPAPNLQLPFSLNLDGLEELAKQLSTEELLVETAKVKTML